MSVSLTGPAITVHRLYLDLRGERWKQIPIAINSNDGCLGHGNRPMSLSSDMTGLHYLLCIASWLPVHIFPQLPHTQNQRTITFSFSTDASIHLSGRSLLVPGTGRDPDEVSKHLLSPPYRR